MIPRDSAPNLRIMKRSLMLSTICVECFNDFPATCVNCPYCLIATHEQCRLNHEADGKEIKWDVTRESDAFRHEILGIKRTYALLNLLGAALASLLIAFLMRTPLRPNTYPYYRQDWTSTNHDSMQDNMSVNETGESLKEAQQPSTSQMTRSSTAGYENSTRVR